MTLQTKLPILATALLATAFANSSDPKDLLTKARKALGGESKLGAIQSLTLVGAYKRNNVGMKMIGMGGDAHDSHVISGELQIDVSLPDKFLRSETTEMPMGGSMTRLEGLNGDEPWNDTRNTAGANVFVINRSGSNENRAKNAKASFSRWLLALTLTAPSSQAMEWTYAGTAEAPDGKADVLDGKSADGSTVRLFLNQESHLPLMLSYKSAAPVRMSSMKMEAPDPSVDPKKLAEEMKARAEKELPPAREVEMQMRLGDYRKVDGILFPHNITWSSEGKTDEELEVKKYAVNPRLDAAIFRKK